MGKLVNEFKERMNVIAFRKLFYIAWDTYLLLNHYIRFVFSYSHPISWSYDLIWSIESLFYNLNDICVVIKKIGRVHHLVLWMNSLYVGQPFIDFIVRWNSPPFAENICTKFAANIGF